MLFLSFVNPPLYTHYSHSHKVNIYGCPEAGSSCPVVVMALWEICVKIWKILYSVNFLSCLRTALMASSAHFIIWCFTTVCYWSLINHETSSVIYIAEFFLNGTFVSTTRGLYFAVKDYCIPFHISSRFEIIRVLWMSNQYLFDQKYSKCC